MLPKINFHITCFFLLLTGLTGHAQKITGKVVSQTDKQALAFANVFLNNTQKGATTDENGNFEIKDLPPGNYELIASYIGYETLAQTIQLTETGLEVNIELSPKSIELQEVVIREDKNWKYNYETFVRGFIGQTPNSSKCKITNPDILRIIFDPDSALLKVTSRDFLIIENQALGYRIKYLLEDFSLYYHYNYQTYWGFTLFEEMKPKNRREAEKWHKKRLEAFLGSTQHFMKAVFYQNYESEGFEVRKLRRILNPDRQPETTIRNAIKSLHNPGFVMNSDTMNYWMKESGKPKILEILNPHILPPDSIVLKTDSLTQLQFTDYLHIVYKKEKEAIEYLQQNRGNIAKRGPQTSLIYLTQPYVHIEENGILSNPLALFVEGYWGWKEKVAEMLPFDYMEDAP